MQFIKQSAVSRRTGQTTVTTSAAPILQIGADSSANTTFTTTTAVDGSAWDLSGVVEGDVAETDDGCAGLITGVNDGTDTLTIDGWYCSGAGRGGWTRNAIVTAAVPAAGSVVTIHRRSHARLIGLKADADNSNDISIGIHGNAVAADYVLENGEIVTLVPEPPNEYIDLTQVYAIASAGTPTLHWIIGGKPGSPGSGVGPAGPQGPQGDQGIQGIQGVAGADGADGTVDFSALPTSAQMHIDGPDLLQASEVMLFHAHPDNSAVGMTMSTVKIATSAASTYSVNFEVRDDPTDASPDAVATVATAASVEAETGSFALDAVTVGRYLFVTLPATDVDYVDLFVFFVFD